jgi:hypothetical protein
VSDNEELDPEIAELLGVSQSKEDNNTPEIDASKAAGKIIPKTKLRAIDLGKVFADKNVYQKIMNESDEHGKRTHELLSSFLKAVDKDEKSMYRERLIPAYWNMLTVLIDNLFHNLTDEKLALYRYGLLNKNFIDDRQKDLLLKANQAYNPSEDICYVDEWLMLVGNGKIRQSAVDETKKKGKNSPSAQRAKLERKTGSKDAELVNLKQKINHHLVIEKNLSSIVSMLIKHQTLPEYDGTNAPYTAEQKKLIPKIQDILRNLARSDKEIENAYKTLRSLEQEIKSLEESGDDLSIQVDTKTVMEEFITIRQMTKMTVGRQGNHFPFLVKSYMPRHENDICTKEVLKQTLLEIEGIDPGVFIRKYKQEEHRIIPHFIIVPSYGKYGICWEPFDRMNKATSKGRIAVPFYPRELKTTVLYALGDLRWQVAKEKALHYWMEEGLTGHYYDYAQQNKIKGDLKESFIQDYILWIKFESQGMQKLHKDVRSTFWRYIPFPQELKESLRNRGYYYADLYKKDQTRAMSRGY